MSDSSYNLYEDISKRTSGEIYLGIVGPVRTGKSAFIRKFMELMVIPNMEDGYALTKVQDELPQSSAGTTIMTTEPKFIPNESVSVTLADNVKFKVKLIDCVGYLIDGASGYMEDGEERKVDTPWSQSSLPFTTAAEFGTEKVISEHSTIGIVMTTDGSITGIDRSSYKVAEEKTIKKLKEINKPFIVVLNTQNPDSEEILQMADEMQEEYGVCVVPINVMQMGKEEINKLFEIILYEFPISEIAMQFPKWLSGLDKENEFKNGLINHVKSNMCKLNKMADAYDFVDLLATYENIENVNIKTIDLGTGTVNLNVDIKEDEFYQILSKELKINISNDYELMTNLKNLSGVNEDYQKYKLAIDEVNNKGYGVVIPRVEELQMENPEIIRQGNKYGVKVTVKAPSIHMIEANVEAEVAPIVGSEEQSKDLIDYINNEYEKDPSKIWDINVFGKTLNELVKDELEKKLDKLSEVSKERFQLTLQRVINEGTGNLICIII